MAGTTRDTGRSAIAIAESSATTVIADAIAAVAAEFAHLEFAERIADVVRVNLNCGRIERDRHGHREFRIGQCLGRDECDLRLGGWSAVAGWKQRLIAAALVLPARIDINAMHGRDPYDSMPRRNRGRREHRMRGQK